MIHRIPALGFVAMSILATCVHIAAQPADRERAHPLSDCSTVLQLLHSRGPPQGAYAERWALRNGPPVHAAVSNVMRISFPDGGRCRDNMFLVSLYSDLPPNTDGLMVSTWVRSDVKAAPMYAFSVTAGEINCLWNGEECRSIELSGGMAGTIEWDGGWVICNGCQPTWWESALGDIYESDGFHDAGN